MQIPQIWRFLETHMTRTPHHSKKKKSAVHGLPLTQAAVGGFFIIWYVHIGRYASFVHNSLVVMVIAFSMPFGYTCLAISGKEKTPCQRLETYVPNVELNISHIMVSKIKW